MSKSGSTPGWIHFCQSVGHEVWTSLGVDCPYCSGRMAATSRGRDDDGQDTHRPR